MNFLHLWALGIGAVAITVPVAVHFLTKPRPVTRPLATIRFLLEVIEEKRARSRLRDLLVMLLRMLAIGLLAMALARPWFSNSKNIEAVPEEATARIIIIDVSQSMSAKMGNTTAIQQAQSRALKYIEYAPNLRANVVFAGAKPRPVFPVLSLNLATLRDAVKNAAVRSERCDVKSAMTQVGNMIAQTKITKTELIIISDFQRTNWSNLYLNSIPTETKIQLESVAVGVENNLAITGFRLGNRAIVDTQVMLEFDVANLTDQPADVKASIDLTDVTTSVQGRVPAQSSTTLTAPLTFTRPQWVTGWIELNENVDAIQADDSRPVSFQVEQPPKMLLLTQPNKSKQANGRFYLEQALQVIAGDGASKLDTSNSSKGKIEMRERLTVLAPTQIDANELSDVNIYVLYRCGALERSAVDLIASRVRRGQGLLYIASDLVDAVNLDLFASSMGSSYQPPVQLVPSDNEAKRKDLFVRDLRARQPPFAVFAETAMAAMQTTRISGGLATRALEDGLKDQVLAELSDSSALLFMTSCDAGTVAVINADLDQSNWCSQPSFFPVLNELVLSMLSNRNIANEAAGGEPMVRSVSSKVPESATLNAEAADKRSMETTEFGSWEWNETQNAFVWSWSDPVGPGSYLLRNQREAVQAVSIAAPSMESDPKTLDSSLLQGRLAGSRSVGFSDSQSSDQKSDQWWNWLIIACVLGLFSEILVLRWFSA